MKRDRSGAMHKQAPIRAADGPAFSACSVFSARCTDDWAKVTCGLCIRSRASIERRTKRINRKLGEIAKRRAAGK